MSEPAPMRLLLSGVTSTENRGVAALIATITAGVRRLGPAAVTVATQTPGYDSAHLGRPGVRFVLDPFTGSASWPVERAAAAPVDPARLLAETDLLVTTGGDLHTSEWGVSDRYLAAPEAAIEAGIPTAMLAHTFGPLDEAEAKALGAVAAAADLVTVRETASHRYLTQALDHRSPNLHLTGDPAYLLPAAPRWRRDALLARAGLPPGSRWLCLAPSASPPPASGIDRDAWREAWSVAAGALSRQRRLPIVLLAHVEDSRPGNDDRRLIAAIADRITGRGVLPAHPLTAADHRALIAGAEALVTGRLHAAIAAYATGTPAVTIGSGRKYAAVAEAAYGHREPGATIAPEALADDPRTLADHLGPNQTRRLARILKGRTGLLAETAGDNFTQLGPLWQAARRRARGRVHA